MPSDVGTTESPRPESNQGPATEFFRALLIPENQIPSLVEKSPGGGPDEWDRIADDWRQDQRNRTLRELQPNTAKPDPATLRASIKMYREWWIESPQDFVNLYPILADWWNTARLIEGTSPPPPIPIQPSLSGQVADDVQVALTAADTLLVWCGQDKAPDKKYKRQDNKQSWTQPELDAAISADIEKHAELIAAAKRGKAGGKRRS